MQKIIKDLVNQVTWAVIIILLGTLIMQLVSGLADFRKAPIDQVMSILQNGEKLKEVVIINGDQVTQITTEAGQRIQPNRVGRQVDGFMETLRQCSAAGTFDQWVARHPTPNLFTFPIYTGLPFLLLAIGSLVAMRMVSNGGSGGPLSFGESKARLASKDMLKTTFANVVGVDEAVEELQGVKEFLAKLAKSQKLSTKIPKGVLLCSPSGTGKTLPVYVVTGETGVPLFSISDFDFVEMFVGIGASRVRDLLKRAKEAAPAIVSIDKVGVIGRHCGAGMGDGHDERERTLSQLLAEMDGFDVRGGVILIAATNRPDILGPALLHPGCFDRQVSAETPDLIGRSHILQVHTVGKPLTKDIDFDSMVRRIPGFSGTDLANVLNEVALPAIRLSLNEIGQAQFDEAIDRAIAGPQKYTHLMNNRERLITAYHKGGYALVAAMMLGSDPIQKVTILPCGRTLGYAMVMSDDDKYLHIRGELLDQIAYMMGGRAVEEMIFYDSTIGAQNDIEKATKAVRVMVTQYGMSERVGAVRPDGGDSEPSMRVHGAQPSKDFSEASAATIDKEAAELISAAHQEAYGVLVKSHEVFDKLARQLFTKETLNKAGIAEVFKNPKRRDKRPAWTGSELRVPFTILPVEVPVSPGPPSWETPPRQTTHRPLLDGPPDRRAPPVPENRR